MSNSEYDVDGLRSKVADLITGTRKGYELWQNRIIIAQIFSCLDAISDTQLAIEAFEGMNLGEYGIKELYLIIYGLLQSFFVQQDAAKNLCAALGEEVDF